MHYQVSLEGFEGDQLEVVTGGLFSGPKLLMNGQPAPPGPKRGQFLLRRSDGSERVASLQSSFVDPIPQLLIDGKRIQLGAPLTWYQWILVGLPLVLIFIGGLLGGLIGVSAAFINGRIFRSNMAVPIRYLAVLGVTVIAVIMYFVLAIALNIAIRGG